MRDGSPALVAAVIVAALNLGTGTAHASTADVGAVVRAGGSGGCGASGSNTGRSGESTDDDPAGCDGVPQPYGFLFGQNGAGAGSGLTPGAGSPGAGSSGGAGTSGGGGSGGGVLGAVLDAVRELLGRFATAIGG